MGRRTADHCVDASTFQMYMANMKSIFMDMIKNTDMVIFNRCKEDDPLPTYRRGIKVANQRAEVIFEDEEGEMGDIFQDEMPFDMDAPVIDILPEDYGIWFVDAMDHPENYEGKTVKFKARVMKPRGMGSKFFVPGRTAMTCCADDTTFLGYVCKSAYAPNWPRIMGRGHCKSCCREEKRVPGRRRCRSLRRSCRSLRATGR